MKISVSHSTCYRYDSPVTLEPHEFRLRPRTDGSQRAIRHQLRILPHPAGTTECLDQDGNSSLLAWFTKATSTLQVQSEFEVELLRTNPFDYVLPQPFIQLPLIYDDPLRSALGPCLLASQTGAPVIMYARAMLVESRNRTLNFLSELTRAIYRDFRQIVRPDGPALSAEATLAAGEGSCRDFAVLFCGVARAVGLAARFVSGYEREAAGAGDAYMHAWAEVYLPGAGWRGYDPARGVAVTTSHVAVAASFHPDLAAPITGAFLGSAQPRMEVSLRMDVSQESVRA